MGIKINKSANPPRIDTEESKARREEKKANKVYVDLTFSYLGNEAEPRPVFAFSKKLHKELGLATTGLISVYDDGEEGGEKVTNPGIYLVEVPEAQATFQKGKKANEKGERPEKTATFTSANLIEDLKDAGLIPQELVIGTKVFFDVTKVEGNTRLEDALATEYSVSAIYEITPSTKGIEEGGSEDTDEVASETMDEAKINKKSKATVEAEDSFV